MIDAFAKKFKLPKPASHVTRSEVIDGTQAVDNVSPKEVSIFLTSFRASDSRVIFMNLNFDQTIRRRVRASDLSMRRLIYENIKSVEK